MKKERISDVIKKIFAVTAAIAAILCLMFSPLSVHAAEGFD